MTSFADHLKSKSTKSRNGDNSARDLSESYESRNQQRRQQQHGQQEDRNQQRRQPRRDPNWGLLVDGVDHLNLWSGAKTTLGRFLAMEHAHFFKVRKYGEFSSILSLFTFLTTRGHPTRLRFAPTKALFDWITQRRNTELEIHFPNLEYICAEAIAEIVRNAPNIQESLMNTGEHPIVSYREAKTYRRSTRRDEFWATVIRLIRSQLQAEQPLDMSSFYTGEGEPSNAYIDLIRDNTILGQVKGMDDKAKGDDGKKQDPRKTKSTEDKPKRARNDPEGRYFVHKPHAGTEYRVLFVSQKLRDEGLAFMKDMTADERLAFFSPVTPGVDVESIPAEGIDTTEGYVYRLSMTVTVSGDIDKFSFHDLNEERPEGLTDSSTAGLQNLASLASGTVTGFDEGVTVTALLKADGTPMLLSDLEAGEVLLSSAGTVEYRPGNPMFTESATSFETDHVANVLDDDKVSVEDLENENFPENGGLSAFENDSTLGEVWDHPEDLQVGNEVAIELEPSSSTAAVVDGSESIVTNVGTNSAYMEADVQTKDSPMIASVASLQSLQEHFGK